MPLASAGAALLLLLLSPCAGASGSYFERVRRVHPGMDSAQVLSAAGQPTEVVAVARWFYGQDQVVVAGEELIDVRLARMDRRVKLMGRDSARADDAPRVSPLRIGMSAAEALQLAGPPDRLEAGADWYYSGRHRVELTQGVATRVDTHLRASLEVLDWIRLNFSRGGLMFMNITLAFIMFGVALQIKLEHFRRVIAAPRSVLVGFFSQFLALPALTFLLVLLIQPTPSVAMGMILVAACPGGNISNFITSMARGNVALSVSLTAIATLSAVALTPFNFAFWGGLYTDAANLLIPIRIDLWEMVQIVFVLLGIPIALGIWFNHRFPQLTQRIIGPIKALSLVIFIGFVVAALSSNFRFFIDYIHLIFLIVFAHNLLALLTGFALASLFGLPRPDRRTLTIETGIQNSGLGLVLIFNPGLFGGLGGMAFVAAWWGIWHILSGLLVATLWPRIGRLSHPPAPHTP